VHTKGRPWWYRRARPSRSGNGITIVEPRNSPPESEHPHDDALARLAHEGRDLLAVVVARAQLLARQVRSPAGHDAAPLLDGLAAIERVALDLARRIERAERAAAGGPDDARPHRPVLPVPSRNGERGGR